MAPPVSRPTLQAAGNIPRGIFLTLVSTVFFILIDTCAKKLGQLLPILEVAWARFVFHTLVVLALLLGRRIRYARSKRAILQVFRSIMLAATTVRFFAGIQKIDLAMASSIMFLSPILGKSSTLRGTPQQQLAQGMVEVLESFAAA